MKTQARNKYLTKVSVQHDVQDYVPKRPDHMVRALQQQRLRIIDVHALSSVRK